MSRDSPQPTIDSNLIFITPSKYSPAFTVDSPNPIEEWSSPGRRVRLQSEDTDVLAKKESERKLSIDSDDAQQGTSTLVQDVVGLCMETEEDTSETSELYIAGVDTYFPEMYYPTFVDEFENAYEMAKDQIGCRILQKRLDECNPYVTTMIFDRINAFFPELMTDPFGNYLCQRLIELCDDSQLGVIIQSIAPFINDIGVNAYGTRAIQKLVECVKLPTQIMAMADILDANILELAKDINGNHIIQRCLYSFSSADNQFVYEKISQNLLSVATHRHGCCVLQRCINAADISQSAYIVDQIVLNSVDLVQDAFGNYVVQFVLDLNIPDVNTRLAYIFTANMLELSRQKFSSNVIEKCLQQTEPDVQLEMITEIGKACNIGIMLQDQYANYVVQRAIALAPEILQEEMLINLKPSLEGLKKTQFGKRIFSKLTKQYPTLR